MKTKDTLINYSIISVVILGIIYLVNTLVQSISSNLSNILMFIAFIALTCLGFFIIYKLYLEYRTPTKSITISEEKISRRPSTQPSVVSSIVESLAPVTQQPFRDMFNYKKKKIIWKDTPVETFIPEKPEDKSEDKSAGGRGGRGKRGGGEAYDKKATTGPSKKEVIDRHEKYNNTVTMGTSVYFYNFRNNPFA